MATVRICFAIAVNSLSVAKMFWIREVNCQLPNCQVTNCHISKLPLPWIVYQWLKWYESEMQIANCQIAKLPNCQISKLPFPLIIYQWLKWSESERQTANCQIAISINSLSTDKVIWIREAEVVIDKSRQRLSGNKIKLITIMIRVESFFLKCLL